MTSSTKDPLRPGRAPVLFSVALHVAVVMATWWAHAQADVPLQYESFQIEIVSMSDLDALPTVAQEELVVDSPEEAPREAEAEPEPPPPDPEPEVPPTEPPPERRPQRDSTPPAPPRTQTPPTESPPQTTPIRAEESSEGNIAVRMEGLRRDFPAYYARILGEIDRCFRPPSGGSWRTTVTFEIHRDGSVPGRSIRVTSRSGNTAFDVLAVGAVECAGSGRFGPLPPEFSWDVLPVQLTFTRPGTTGGGDEFSTAL